MKTLFLNKAFKHTLLPLSASMLVLGSSSHASAGRDEAKRACVSASTEGQTLRDDGKLMAAREQMLQCARDVCPSVIRAHCTRWASELDDEIPSVVVRPRDANGADLVDVRVTIDGRPSKVDGRPVSLDPGEHAIVIDRADGSRREEHVLLVNKEKSRIVSVVLTPPKATPPPPPPDTSDKPAHTPQSDDGDGESHPHGGVPAGAWVLGGIGVVALAGGAYLGFSASSDYDSLKQSCAPQCTTGKVDPLRTKVLLFQTSIGVGIGALGAAAIWAILSPSSKPGSSNSAQAPRFDVMPTAGGFYSSVTGYY